MVSNKNEVFEYLIDQLRQQVNSNPYKQQCEDLANEVQSLKNQLRDMSALVAELQKELDITKSTVVRLSKEGIQRCDHVWYRYNLGGCTKMCTRCGLKR